VDIVDIVTVDLEALLDSPRLEWYFARLKNRNRTPLPPLNVYAMDLLRSYGASKKIALGILVPKKLEKYSEGLKELLEFKAPYGEIRIITYDSLTIYKLHLKKSSYHVTSSMINLIQNPHRNTGMITNYLTYLPLYLFFKRIKNFRVHFFGLFNILSNCPIILPLFCLFINIMRVFSVNPVGDLIKMQRALLISSYICISAADNLASLVDVPYQRRKFYLEQITPRNSQEFIQDYTSMELTLGFSVLCMLVVILFGFLWGFMGILGGFLLGVFAFFSYSWAWYFKYPLRIMITLLVSVLIQLTIFF
jgi:hypothetical protein